GVGAEPKSVTAPRVRVREAHLSHFRRKWIEASISPVVEGDKRSPPPLETIVTQMRAALFDRYGPPEVLYAGTRPIAVVGPDRLLVRVHAVTVNGGDLILRSGQLPRWLMRGRFPRQIGLDFVGEVAELGDGTHGYAVGDRVWGALDEQPDENGQALRSLADYVALAPTHLSPAPA